MSEVDNPRRSPARILLAAVGSGLLLCLAFPPWHWSAVAWVALIPWAFAVRACWRWSQAALVGAVTGGVFAAGQLEWLRTSYCGDDSWLGPYAFSWLVLILCCALVNAVGSALMFRILRHRRCFSFAVPVIWLAQEQLLEIALWRLAGITSESHQLAVSQANCLSVLQVARVGGPWAVGWIVALINGLAADLLWCFVASKDDRPHAGIPALAALQIFAAVAFGWLRLQTNDPTGPKFFLHLSQRFESPPRDTGTPEVVDLRIWPELAYPRDASSPEATAELQRAAEDYHCPILVGTERIHLSPTHVRNAVVLVMPDGTPPVFSDKCHLTPPPLVLIPTPVNPTASVPVERHRPGETQTYGSGSSDELRLLTIPREDASPWKFGVGICYDLSFTDWSRRLMQRGDPPDFLIHCGSESLDRSGRAQSLLRASCQLRGVETGRAIVRCIHSGHSGVIDPCGRWYPPPLNADAGFVVTVPLGRETTLFTRFGAAGLAALLGIFLTVGACVKEQPQS